MKPIQPLDEFEHRLRTALANALRRAAARDPAWRNFKVMLTEAAPRVEPAQKGASSSSEPRDDDSAG